MADDGGVSTKTTPRTVLVLAIVIVAGLSGLCRKPGAPPDKPVIIRGPGRGVTSIGYEFAATAASPENEDVAIRFDWGGELSGWSEFVRSSDPVRMAKTWTAPGTYAVKAQARVEAGAESEWSDPRRVVITVNRPPGAPATPGGTTAGRKDSTCTFTAVGTDPDGDSIQYRFDWGNGDTSSWTGLVASGEQGSASHAWRRSGVFAVRAQAEDEHGARSGWSDARGITIVNNPPNTPSVPAGPARGRPDRSYDFLSSASDPDGDSVSIRFCWGDGDTSDWCRLVTSGHAVTATHSWRDTGVYHIRAQARDEEGVASAWSAAATVSITRLKWRYRADGRVNSSPAIGADGTVYVGSDDGCLYAINPDGTRKWWYWTGGWVRSAPAIGADGTVYVVPLDDYLDALNPNGTLRWRYRAGGQIASSPAIGADGTVYFGSGDGYFYALNSDSTLQWRHQVGGWVVSSPAIGADGTVYFGSGDGYLYALYPNGAVRWRYETGSQVASSPAIGADGTVYVSSYDHHLYAVSPDGALRWRYETGDSVASSPAIGADGTVYFGSRDNHFYALTPSGTLRWRHPADWAESSPAVDAEGTVYVGAGSALIALNPDGTLKWWYRTGGRVASSPAIATDGTVYLGSEDNCLHAVEGGGPLANSPWPRFRHDNSNTGRVSGGR